MRRRQREGHVQLRGNFSPTFSPMQTEFAHQNFYNQFKKELGGDPILFPAEPNQFSTVVDKVMVGTTADHAQAR